MTICRFPSSSAPSDIRVRMTAAALNHLDLFVVSGMPGVSIRAPWTLGADGCGVIDQVGSAVDGLRVGDRVVINPGISDRSCEYCKAGEQSLCVRGSAFSASIIRERWPSTWSCRRRTCGASRPA